MKRIGDLGEVAFLERALGEFSPVLSTTWRGPGGDAALLAPEGGPLAISTDAVVEGIHFDLSFMTLEDVAWRAIVGALGDLAAVGASPRAVLLSCGLPRDLAVRDALGIYRAASRLGAAHHFDVVGGDLVESPRAVFLDVVVVGRTAPVESCPDRVGAKPGDLLAVTGDLGSARAGLDALRAGRTPRRVGAMGRFLRPDPPMEMGRRLAEMGPSAMTDISDGLCAELFALGRANPGIGFEVDLWRIPLGPGVSAAARRRAENPARFALLGGEDSELLVALSPDKLNDLGADVEGSGPGISVIGRVTSRPAEGLRKPVFVRSAPGAEAHALDFEGYQHLRG